MTYLVVVLIAAGIAAIWRGLIKPASEKSRRSNKILAARAHLAQLPTPFVLEPGESVRATAIASTLGGVRRVSSNDGVEDEYKDCFALVYLTTARIAVLMSTSDEPTQIYGMHTAGFPTVSHRLGGHTGYDAHDAAVSSFSIHLTDVTNVSVASDLVAVMFDRNDEVAAVMLGIEDATEHAALVTALLASTQAARAASGFASVDPTASVDDDGMQSFDFAAPAQVCSSCGTPYRAERFCTGCGTRLLPIGA